MPFISAAAACTVAASGSPKAITPIFKYNVDSITRGAYSVGHYYFNFLNAFANADYTVVAMAGGNAGAIRYDQDICTVQTRGASSVEIITSYAAGASPANVDPTYLAMICIGAPTSGW